MEKFKLLLEQAQRLNEGDLLSNVKLLPTPDDLARGVGNLLAKPFRKNKETPQQTQQQTQQTPASSDTAVYKKRSGMVFYFRMDDKQLPNPLFIKYDLKTKQVDFISEIDFKKIP